MFIDVLFIAAGITLLVVGAEYLVRGAAGMAIRMGISALVVGLTIVALGTSAPELVVACKATLADQGDLAIGAVIGSNICNILLILGFAAMLRGIPVHRQVLTTELPILFASVLLFGALLKAGDGLSRLDGGILTGGIAFYIMFTLNNARKNRIDPEEIPDGHEGYLVLIYFIILGLVGLKFGGDFLVDGAVNLARRLDVSEGIIGLTIVAFGSSLPELATAIAATRKNHGDLVTGNVVGSNIFNTLCILGIAALVKPIALDSGLRWVDYFFMVGVCAAAFPILASRLLVSRLEGTLMLTTYAGYIAYIALKF